MNAFANLAHLLLLPCSLLVAPALLAQGPLAPGGPPAPTMKTLQQVEPRTDLQATPLPPGVSTDANTHFIINQPGSYYLSANLGVTKLNGIQVNAEGVTIDLQDFQISRASGTGGAGISILTTGHRCVVTNGSVKGFADGVVAVQSIEAAKGGAFSHLVVSGCSGVGLRTGDSWRIAHCSATDNGGVAIGISLRAYSEMTHCLATRNGSTGIAASGGVSITDSQSLFNGGDGVTVSTSGKLRGVLASGNDGDGIRTGAYASLTNCSADNNTNARYGISVGQGSSVTHCTAAQNSATDVPSYGIHASFGSTVTGCTAAGNTGAGQFMQGVGIYAGSGSTVSECTVRDNGADGIQVGFASQVRNNQCDGNGSDTSPAAGIHATGNSNRIEANNVSGSARGIEIDGTRNIIIRNSAADNTTNYEIAADNRYGTIVDLTAPGSAAVSGNSAAATTVSTNAWANFAY